MTDSKEGMASLNDRGWIQLAGVVSPPLIDRLRFDLQRASLACRAIQQRNGLLGNIDGTVHHVVGQGESFLELIDVLPVGIIERYFEAKFILNSFGGVINLRNHPSYVCTVHRDLRTYSGSTPAMLNLLLMLDDFTLENGATYLLSASHKADICPTDADFFLKAERAIGAAGSVVLFNSNLWHAAGINTTDIPRRALTLTFTRPFIKPQFDYPRMLGYDRAEQFSELRKQILGYYSRIPATLEEWYQPPARRMYRSGQG
ncbi:MAG: phytanoyl-CoA dioxygenase [Planctomycetaceae bacterium]|nr:phytanoyl-CoA dioxygenase [Planctomycetaceae bacterium]